MGGPSGVGFPPPRCGRIGLAQPAAGAKKEDMRGQGEGLTESHRAFFLARYLDFSSRWGRGKHKHDVNVPVLENRTMSPQGSKTGRVLGWEQSGSLGELSETSLKPSQGKVALEVHTERGQSCQQLVTNLGFGK